MVRLAEKEGSLRTVIRRLHINLRGAVQGVGFRPYVYRLASELKLPGWVLNSPEGVFIEVEGEKEILESFLIRLQAEKPAISFIQSLEFSFLDPAHFEGFEIRKSETGGEKTTLILPDIATCDLCLAEVFDSGNRRYRYPFTNCTNCGPRFTIIESLPYDRSNTSMKSFAMCPDCRAEYENPGDRRFHAQPNACPVCGPALELWDGTGKVLERCDEALQATAAAIRQGAVVAVKGLGGFHLIADARNTEVIEKLRTRKHREEKPFALMYPTLGQIKADCGVAPLEERLLRSSESPIVLLEARRNSLSPSVAPGNPYRGVMLPYTPLHHLLMREVGFPVVATSGNLSDEPICIEERDALARLNGISDLFLVHNRPIVRHVDDSIVRVVLGRELVLRRARGYAPLPLRCNGLVTGILAVGGHLKNTVALAVADNVFVSQHIGDLENSESLGAFKGVIRSFCRLYQTDPRWVVSDLHPDYLSTKYAAELGIPRLSVQHHYAHVAACMAENELDGRVLGVAWDGTGYGQDGTVWGGEFLLTDSTGFTRIASFRKFRLPGSAAAVKEPRRTALGLLYEVLGPGVFDRKDLNPVSAFTDQERSVVAQMLQKGIHSPWTSSAGRLFDAVASLTGLRQTIRFEGQAAMELEFAIGPDSSGEEYPFDVRPVAGGGQPMIIDWELLVRAILRDVENRIAAAAISRKFHNTLAEIIAVVAQRVAESRVVLTGGCFQNRFLLERTIEKLERKGFCPYWHQRVPPNDGGIALGQIIAASRILKAG
jgi:hydrogenase maturation protein HypF